VEARGREPRFRTAAQRSSDLPAVRLVADHGDGLPATCDHGANVVHGRARGELAASLRGPEAQVGGRLARTQERAREHHIGLDPFGTELLAEKARLLVTFWCEGTQLVRSSLGCLGMADEDQSHGAP
jgi:hypothetical protein